MYVWAVSKEVPLISFNHASLCLKASLAAQTVNNLPAMQETWVLSLGQEDPLEKEMVTHSSIHAWRIPWTEEPGGLQSRGCKESDTTESDSSSSSGGP